MRRLKDSNHVPATPKSYVHVNGHKMGWPASLPWQTFVSQVIAYATRNGIKVPTEADIHEQICRQIPANWCVEEGTVGYASVRQPRKSGGCKSCGGRR